jgi:hypothetical protein
LKLTLAGIQIRYDHLELYGHDNRGAEDCAEKLSSLQISNSYQRKTVGELKGKLGELNSLLTHERSVHFKENKMANKVASRLQEKINGLEQIRDKLDVKAFEDRCRIGELETKVTIAEQDLIKQQRSERKRQPQRGERSI